MRRKQLFVFMLTGALTVGAVPSAAFGAEDAGTAAVENEMVTSGEDAGQESDAAEQADAPADTSAEVPAETPGEPEPPADTPVEPPAETPVDTPAPEIPVETPAAPTEAPVDTPAETPTEAPVDTPAPETPTPAPETPPAGETDSPLTAGTEGNADGQIPSGQAGEETKKEDTGVTVDDHTYPSLAEALAAVASLGSEETVNVYVNEDQTISSTITLASGSKVILVPTRESVTIKRAADFKGNMFQVEGGTLSFSGGEIVDEKGETSVGTITVNGSLADGSASEGSIVEVKTGSFLLNEGAALTGNNTSAQGSAVKFAADTYVTLMGGSITGNTTSAGNGGAVYGEADLDVSGTVTVSGNQGADGAAANVVLASGSSVTVSDKLSGSQIGVKVLEGAAGTQVLSVAEGEDGQPVVSGEELASQITYDDETLKIDESGVLADAGGEPTPSPEVTPSETPTPSPEATATPTPTAEPTVAPTVAPVETELSMNSLEWTSSDSLRAKFTFNKNGRYYALVLNSDTEMPDFDEAELQNNGVDAVEGRECTFSSNFSRTLDQSRDVSLAIYFRPAGSDEVYTELFEMDSDSRPARLTGVSARRDSASRATIVLRSNKSGTFYVEWTRQSDNLTPDVSCEGAGTAITANTDQTYVLDSITTSEPISVWVRLMDTEGIQSGRLRFDLGEAPEEPDTPYRQPVISVVTDSRVTGLDRALEFYPNTFYDFTVTGAGYDIETPYVKGDVRWTPKYWSTSANPSDSQKHTTWRIGSPSGIRTAATYNLYVFFQREEYDGTQWVAQSTIERATYQFRSADISMYTGTPTPTYGAGSGYGGSGESGYSGYYDENGVYHYYNEEDPQNQVADGSVTGSTTAKGAQTSDDAPVGNFLALAFASLLACGSVLTRKRRRGTEKK